MLLLNQSGKLWQVWISTDGQPNSNQLLVEILKFNLCLGLLVATAPYIETEEK